MNKAITDIKQRIKALEYSGYIEIPYLENGIYKTKTLSIAEAKKLATMEIEEKL